MNNAATPTNIDVGIAGSLTMVALVIAFTLLVISFYRRYNKALKKRDEDQN
jgi:cbb3-type cytochrome oxidase subunit 3